MKKTNVMLMLRLYLVIIIFVISGSVTAIISQSKYENQKTIRIVLLGDSLIGRPYNNHDLSGRILGQIYPQTWVPYIELINSGKRLINVLLAQFYQDLSIHGVYNNFKKKEHSIIYIMVLQAIVAIKL